MFLCLTSVYGRGMAQCEKLHPTPTEHNFLWRKTNVDLSRYLALPWPGLQGGVEVKVILVVLLRGPRTHMEPWLSGPGLSPAPDRVLPQVSCVCEIAMHLVKSGLFKLLHFNALKTFSQKWINEQRETLRLCWKMAVKVNRLLLIPAGLWP